MNTIAIIENKPNDFDSVKKMFKASNVWPTDFSEFWKKTPQKKPSQSNLDYENLLVSSICEQIYDNINTLSAIIMDISLYSDLDESGLMVIKKIRDKKNAQYNLIPIFCYSRHGETPEIREKALAAGATNIFDKQDIGNKGKVAQRKIEEFQITMRAQMVAYEVSMGEIQTLQEIRRIENSLSDMRNTQMEDSRKLNITTEMLLSMISVSNLNSIVDDEDNMSLIEKIVGGKEQLEQIRQKMYQSEDKKHQVELLDDISDVLSSIPGLNFVFPFVPKLLSMIQKNTD